MPSSSRKPTTLPPPCQPAAYWPRAVPCGQVLGQPDGRQHLLLLLAQRVGVERHRLLHRGQREQLQQVVLDDVAGRADAVVVPGPAADPDVLGHRDLHVVDVVAVPDRLVQGVGEAQRQDVLDRLLAQVVVDAEDRLGGEHRVDDAVELLAPSPGRGRTASRSPPGARLAPGGVGRARVGQPGPLELLHHGGEELRRDRQVERVVAAGAALDVELADASARAARTPRRRRTRRARSGRPPAAAARPSRGTACARAP